MYMRLSDSGEDHFLVPKEAQPSSPGLLRNPTSHIQDNLCNRFFLCCAIVSFILLSSSIYLSIQAGLMKTRLDTYLSSLIDLTN